MSILSNIIGKIFHSGAATAANPNVAAGAAANPNVTSSSSTSVDVAAELSAMAAQSSEKLNWQTSIVDLMKLLKLDSGLASRKELAVELGYKGTTDDTASMNKWLISEVMKKLAANGGKVPAELMH
jgi:hypothetical protein